MHRSIGTSLLVILIALAGCERPGPTNPAPSPKQSSTTTNGEATFELEGTVQEASGSTSHEKAQSPSPSPSVSKRSRPSASPSLEPSPSASVATGSAIIIERGAPGSLAVKIQRYTAAGSPCRFVENDILVVAFTVGTDFQPSEVTDRDTFPKNLKGSSVQITGRLEEKDRECLLIAKTVRVGQTAASPVPSKSPTRTRTSPSVSQPASVSPSPSA